MKNYKVKIIAGVVIAAVLAAVFWIGAPVEYREHFEHSIGLTDTNESGNAETAENEMAENTDEEEPAAAPEESKPSEEKMPPQTENKGEAALKEEPQPAKNDAPEEAKKEPDKNEELTCYLSVRCDTAIAENSGLSSEKREILPPDGTILAETEVVFYEGESVFNVLVREMKKHKIHLEFVNTPVYKSAYIEGIANLYEFDCGDLSGWMYRVNGVFPDYGASRYILKDKDKIEWVYSCNLGKDVGGDAGGGQRDE